MTDKDNVPYKYHKKCKTCNLPLEQAKQVHLWHDTLGPEFTKISKLIKATYDEDISHDAVANHIRKHSNVKNQEQALLGVVPPKEFKPGYNIQGDKGTATSTPQTSDSLTDFDQMLREVGLDTDRYAVEGKPSVGRWQIYSGEWRMSYKFNIVEKKSLADLQELIDIVKDIKPSGAVTTGKYAFVFAAGDLQLGKSDGDGTEGIVKRYRASLQKAVDKVIEFKHLIGPIVISWVGDCIEGMVSQGGRNARRTELTTTQQVRLLRLLMTETVKAFAPLTDDLRVVSVPGNHDEAQREPVTTDHSDSWAVDALVAVSEAVQFNPEAFGHVTFEVVPFDEMTTTIEVAGSIITHAHGHQWSRGKHFEWWSGQHWGGHAPGQADILICGHFHTGTCEQENFKYMVRTPSFEKESTYYRHKTGKIGNPSAVTFLTRNGSLKYIDFE